ncbi:MAG: alpha/beta hydrolase [Candidatus Helarchaeota archaeon]
MSRIFNVKSLSYGTLLLNLIAIVFGAIYLITMHIYSIIWDLTGFLYVFALFANFALVYLDSLKINKTDKTGYRISILGYLYLIFIGVGMFGMFFGNFLYSITYSPDPTAHVGAFVLIGVSYFGSLIFGLMLSYLHIRNLTNPAVWEGGQGKPTSLKKKIIKIVLMVFCYLILLIGVYFTIITLFGADLGVVSGAIGMFVAQFDLFFVFTSMSATIFLLKLKDRKASPKSYYGVAILGLFLTGILIAPVCSTPFAISSADAQFTAAFGANWQANIPAGVQQQFFLQTPFALGTYFLGMSSNNYRVNANILFYDAEGIKLYFDAYMPTVDGSTLPGNNSVIIRIHGGGWTAGDKGFGNMMQMNKYFAAQGYVVFDIQYGLHDEGWELLPTPDYVKGNFTVDDMVRHIGNFTKYLGVHAKEFNANLDSVFISGGSAGGHLTCAVGLGIASGNYSAIFGTDLTIKGIIPFYPANGHPARFGGSDEFINPDDYLINASSPPCLVFQGLQDGLVHPDIAQDLKDAYTNAGNPDCAVLYFPFAGHAADLYFTGYYNLVFLYYMERFLYLCVHDFI